MMTDIQRNLFKEQRRNFDQFSARLEKRLARNNTYVSASVIIAGYIVASAILIGTF